MAEEPDVIREQIEETRSALTEKLETLEGQVRETVQSAKATVEDTLETVKSSVQHTVDSVKQTFDLGYQVDRHPWAMTGGSFVIGFLLGNYLEGRRQTRPVYPPQPNAYSQSNGGQSMMGYTAPREAPAQPSLVSRVLSSFDDEIDKVKGVAIGAGLALVRDLAKRSLPQLASQIDDVANSATVKLGGEPWPGSFLQPDDTASGPYCGEEARRPAAWQ
jgi:ElaB/YqjD/DUF883 family membrane-anchored ribosome-binding protein